jgi:hypothetical protein
MCDKIKAVNKPAPQCQTRSIELLKYGIRRRDAIIEHQERLINALETQLKLLEEIKQMALKPQ